MIEFITPDNCYKSNLCDILAVSVVVLSERLPALARIKPGGEMCQNAYIQCTYGIAQNTQRIQI